jgi:putative membrane protein
VKTVYWGWLAALVAAQISYPLTGGSVRAALVVSTVAGGYALSVSHAASTRGFRTAARLVLVTTCGGLLVEVVGLATGFPFGRYGYGAALGPTVFGVPVVVPLAWTWMAWPAFIAAGRLTRTAGSRILLAGVALAAWDVFLDPQMVAAGYWHWHDGALNLPGVPGVPLTNYLGWLVAGTAMMALLVPRTQASTTADGPVLGLYLWTYYSSVLAHAVFLDLAGSAAWGAVAMGAVALPLTVRLLSQATVRPKPSVERTRP